MSDTTSGPPLNASGTDPLSEPPAPPPASASNHPDDQAAGIAAEMDALGQAAIVDSKSGRDQQAAPVEETKPTEETADDALKSDKTPPWMKAEITKERNRRREAETAAKTASEERAATAKQLSDALEALKAREAPKEPEPAPIVESPRPTRADFDTPEAYDAAVDTWATGRAEAAAKRAEADLAAKSEADRSAKEKADADAVAAAEVTKLSETWKAKREKAMESMPDYVEVAENTELKIDVPMAHSAIQAENGTEMLYYLGKNPEEAARIAGLSPAGQIFEMGKLSWALAQGHKVEVSRAPPPIAPLQSSRETVNDGNREESMEEVAQRVSRREAAARSPLWGTRH